MNARSLLNARWYSTMFIQKNAFYVHSPFFQRNTFFSFNKKNFYRGINNIELRSSNKHSIRAFTSEMTNKENKNEGKESWVKTLWPKIKREVRYYWQGTKLFGKEIKSSSAILYRVSKGEELSRRDRMLLVRTFNDLLRLIPFSVFVIVPFLEFTLPFFLKIFPNMLPSTFENKLQKEQKMIKKLKARIELAKFLQLSVEQAKQENKMNSSAKESSSTTTVNTRNELLKIMNKVKEGQPVTNEDILQLAKSSEEDYNLDNLPRDQLVAMAKYVGIPQALIITASSNFLRLQIRNKIKKIRADDELIKREGFESLSLEELQTALAARGMRADSDDILILRKRLSEWIDLSLNHNLSEVFLILSRTFLISEPYSPSLSSTTSDEDQKVSASVSTENMDVKKTSSIIGLNNNNTHSKQATPTDTEAAAVKIIFETSAAQELKVELEELKKSMKETETIPTSSIPINPVTLSENNHPSPLKPPHDIPQIITISVDPIPSKNIDESEVKVPIPTKAPTSEVDANIKRVQGKLEKILSDLENEIVQVKGGNADLVSTPKVNEKESSVLTLQQLLDTLRSINAPKEMCDEIISKIDSDKDGKITLKELQTYLLQNHSVVLPMKEQDNKSL